MHLHASLPSFPLEARLLFAAARVPSADAQAALAPLLGAAERDGLDADYLAELLVQHRVRPLVYANLRKAETELLPDPLMARLEHFYRVNAGRNMMKAAELRRVTGLLEAEGLRAVSYKGVLQALRFFGDLALREFIDLDIVVDEASFETAYRLLTKTDAYETATDPRELAFRPEVGLMHPQRRVYIELHKGLFASRLVHSLDMDALWKRLVCVPLAGSGVWSFAAEDLVALLSIHGTKHCWRRLHWLCGLAEMLRATPELDWDAALRHAQQLGAERAVLMSLLLAHDLLDAPLPADVLRQAREDRLVVGLAQRTATWMAFSQTDSSKKRPPRRMQRGWYHLRVREHVLDGLAYSAGGLRRLLTPTDWERDHVPEAPPLSLLRYPLRAARVVAWSCREWLRNDHDDRST